MENTTKVIQRIKQLSKKLQDHPNQEQEIEEHYPDVRSIHKLLFNKVKNVATFGHVLSDLEAYIDSPDDAKDSVYLSALPPVFLNKIMEKIRISASTLGQHNNPSHNNGSTYANHSLESNNNQDFSNKSHPGYNSVSMNIEQDSSSNDSSDRGMKANTNRIPEPEDWLAWAKSKKNGVRWSKKYTLKSYKNDKNEDINETIEALEVDANVYQNKGRPNSTDNITKQLKKAFLGNVRTKTVKKNLVMCYVIKGAQMDEKYHWTSPFREENAHNFVIDNENFIYFRSVIHNGQVDLDKFFQQKIRDNSTADASCWQNIYEMLRKYYSKKVPLQHFRQFIARFGGLKYLLLTVKDMFHPNICSFYHGNITKDEAARRMLGEKSCSFLLRDPSDFNENPYLLAMSYKNYTGACCHARIVKMGDKYSAESEEGGTQSFESLLKLLDSIQEVNLDFGVKSGIEWVCISDNIEVKQIEVKSAYISVNLKNTLQHMQVEEVDVSAYISSSQEEPNFDLFDPIDNFGWETMIDSPNETQQFTVADFWSWVCKQSAEHEVIQNVLHQATEYAVQTIRNAEPACYDQFPGLKTFILNYEQQTHRLFLCTVKNK